MWEAREVGWFYFVPCLIKKSPKNEREGVEKAWRFLKH